MKPLLNAVNVSRSYPDGTKKTFYAVQNANLSICEHALTIIKGRSGSGKTTLLNLMSTLEDPSEGELFFEGISYRELSAKKREALRRRKMGFVFQSIALIPVMTAYENVDFSLRLAGVKKRRERIEALLEAVGMEERMHHLPAQLSGGEQQRVAIARAVAHHPAILFADEPTGALDTDTGIQVMEFFQKLIREEALTVVMTTHDPRLMAMGDILYEMSDGHLEIVRER